MCGIGIYRVSRGLVTVSSCSNNRRRFPWNICSKFSIEVLENNNRRSRRTARRNNYITLHYNTTERYKKRAPISDYYTYLQMILCRKSVPTKNYVYITNLYIPMNVEDFRLWPFATVYNTEAVFKWPLHRHRKIHSFLSHHCPQRLISVAGNHSQDRHLDISDPPSPVYSHHVSFLLLQGHVKDNIFVRPISGTPVNKCIVFETPCILYNRTCPDRWLIKIGPKL